mgnify:CR=1 FL=1
MTSPLANIYARLPVAFTHGQGVWLWDAQGRKYLDALAGIGVSCLGHAHPGLVAAISEQAARVIHTSNIYEVPQQTALAARLTELSGMQEVAFNNSGSEANEAAIKLARYYAYQRGNKHAHIITMDSSWHGRTLATLAATGSDKARKGFEPLPSGFVQVPYNQLDAVRAAGDAEPRTVAVLLEVLQGARSDEELNRRLKPLQIAIEKDSFIAVDMVAEAAGIPVPPVMKRLIVWSIRGLSVAELTAEEPGEMVKSVRLLRRLLSYGINETIEPEPAAGGFRVRGRIKPKETNP